MTEPGELRVASWNVFNRVADSGRILRFVAETRPDLAAFQELLPDHVAALRSLSGYRLVIAEDFREGDEVTHLGLLVRGEILDWRARRHNAARALSPSPVGRREGWVECVESLAARVEIAGRRLRVVNLHLTCGAPPTRRAGELAEIAPDLEGDEPALLLGDFNAFARPFWNWAIGWGYGFGPGDLLTDERARLRAFAARHGLQDTLRGVTFPKFLLQLDHIFARGLVPAGGEILRARFGSDHRPLLARLRV